MTVKQILLLVVIVAAGAAALAYGMARGNDADSGIPVPPPGQRYCTNGERLAFCPDNGSEEWR